MDPEHAIRRPRLRIHQRQRRSRFTVPTVLRPPHRGARLDQGISPYAHAGPGDPPVFLNYPSQDKPPVKGEDQKDPTHTAVLGLLLEERLKAQGDEVHVVYPGRKDSVYASNADFLIAKLKRSSP